MMSLGNRIRQRREMLGMSQEGLAEELGVSFQAVSAWEREVTVPDASRLPDIAATLGTSIDYLMGKLEIAQDWGIDDRLFSEDRMYTFIKAAAAAKGLSQTLKALPFAKESHEGQLRRGKAGIPYISHPLTMCCHALALGLNEDDLLAAILLHDVVEDCGVGQDELPVSAAVRETVGLLSKDSSHEQDEESYDRRYFAAIASHPQAMMVKLLDRCHNLSVMSSGLPRERILPYAHHSQRWVLPLADTLRDIAPQYSNACFLLKYQIQSLIHTVRHLLAGN